MSTSLYSLHQAKDDRVSSRKGHKVSIEQIVLDQEFNIRKINRDHVERFKAEYREGKPVPKIFVFIAEDGNIQVLEGHHRLLAMVELRSEDKKFSKEFESIPVEFFKGDESEKILFMMKSSEGLQLTPTQRADTYLRLEALGKTQKEIASLDKVTVARVSQLLKVAKMDDEVKAAIDEDKISATKVTKIISGIKDIDEACQAVKDALNKHGTKGKVTDAKTDPYKNKYGEHLFAILVKNFELGLCSSEEIEPEEGKEESDEEEGKKLLVQFASHSEDWRRVIKDINAFIEDKESISKLENGEE